MSTELQRQSFRRIGQSGMPSASHNWKGQQDGATMARRQVLVQQRCSSTHITYTANIANAAHTSAPTPNTISAHATYAHTGTPWPHTGWRIQASHYHAPRRRFWLVSQLLTY
jgi:hypothetical protein